MRSRGFSLVEILVVVAIMGIAVAAIASAMGYSLTGQQMRGASRDLVAALRYTRGQAIVKREAQVLMLNVDQKSYRAASRASVQLPPQFDLAIETARQEMISQGEGGIRFFPDGSSTGGNIELSRGDTVWRIDINWLTGEVSLREPGQR
jgi:general secretion pathway protein H